MPLKAVLFDLDDTLYDHQHNCREALSGVHREYACFQRVSYEEFDQRHSDYLEAIHLRVLAGELTLDEARRLRFRKLFAHYGEEIADDALETLTVRYRQAYLAAERLIDGAVALLEQVRAAGLRIGIVTNNTIEEQTAKLKRLGLEPYIDVLTISEAVGVAKPDPRIFAAALRQLGCQPDEVVMVGDSWSADIMGAQAAGIRAVWLNRYGRACPDPACATEIHALTPTETVLQVLLSPLYSQIP